jgi:tetratricopeptide (TPR) repeat protein
MKTRALVLTAAVVVAVVAPLHAQDWRGMGRLEGHVVGPDDKPAVDVTVKLALAAHTGGTTAKTDKKGRWAVGGIAAGHWNIDIDAPGFVPKRLVVDLPGESAHVPPVESKLEVAKAAGPAPEVLDAVKKGDEAYKAGRFAEARAEYEKLLVLRPDLARTLHEQIARCYSQEGNAPKELEHLQVLLDADPANQGLKLLMAQEALKGGLADRARDLLKGVDPAALDDAGVAFNVAALLLNQGKTEESIPYLTRTIALDPASVEGYFRRGLAYLQLGKMAEAKADLRKVTELAPTSPQAETARKGLEQLK